MKIFHLVLPTTGEFTKGNVDTVTATELVDKYDRWLGDKVGEVLALGIGQSLTYDDVIIICVSGKVGYKWSCVCSDGGYTDESDKVYKTETEAYNAMRDAALTKMKWNTERDEEVSEFGCVSYEVTFKPNTIIHKSFSGTYTYRIEQLTY